MSKQDRQGARTVAQLEAKYAFGKTFGEVFGMAEAAQESAEEAAKEVEELDGTLTPEEIFNRLTDNGKLKAIFRGEDGQIYINASYILTGELIADLIKAGVLTSKDGKSIVLDLDRGNAELRGFFTSLTAIGPYAYYATAINGDEIYLGELLEEDENGNLPDARTDGNRARIRRDGIEFDSSLTERLFLGLNNGRWVLTGLSAPVNDNDAARKCYVDNIAVESTDYPGCFYRMVGDVQQWLNPPMRVDDEYATTERISGKVVYARIVDCGELAHAKEISIDSSYKVVRFFGYATNGVAYPYQNNDSAYYRDVIVSVGKITLLCGEKAATANETVRVAIYYTKD